MAQWQTKLEMRDIRGAHTAGTMTVPQMAGEVARRLREKSLRWLADFHVSDELEDVIANFEDIAEHGGDVDDFDGVLESLYDWADDDNRMWIEPGEVMPAPEAA